MRRWPRTVHRSATRGRPPASWCECSRAVRRWAPRPRTCGNSGRRARGPRSHPAGWQGDSPRRRPDTPLRPPPPARGCTPGRRLHRVADRQPKPGARWQRRPAPAPEEEAACMVPRSISPATRTMGFILRMPPPGGGCKTPDSRLAPRQPQHLRMLDIQFVAPDAEHGIHRDVGNAETIRSLDGA